MSRNLSFIFRAKVSTFWLMASLSLAVTIISPAGYFPTVHINERNLVSAYLQATMYTKCTNSIPILSPAKNNNCTIFQLSEYQCVCSMVTGCVLPQIIILFMYSTIPASRKRKQTIKYGLHAQQCMFLLLHAWHTIHQSIYYLQRKASYHFDIIELYKSKILKNCKLAMSSY